MLQTAAIGILEAVPITITSSQNTLFKAVRRASERGDLTPDGYCVGESLHLLEEALAAKTEIKSVLANADGIRKLEQRFPDLRLPVVSLDDALFTELATTGSSQGVIVLARPAAVPDDLGNASLILVIAGVQDPGNAGTLLRAAEAFGADAALLLKGTVSPFLPKALRASAGALYKLPVRRHVTLDEAEGLLQFHGITAYAAMPDASTPAWQADFGSPSAIIVGGEGAGLGAEWSRFAKAISIPIQSVESLNASVAGSILLYEASRQRAARVTR